MLGALQTSSAPPSDPSAFEQTIESFSPTGEATTTRQILTWHNMLTKSDDMASAPATVDLAAMLVNFIQPRVVVEAGTYAGHFAYAIANILRLQGNGGKVYTADPYDFLSVTFNQEGSMQFRPFIHYYHGDFRAMLDSVVPGPIDLAYIDASSKEDPHMRRDHALAAWHRLAYGGIILVDDTLGDWEDAAYFQEAAHIQLNHHRGLTIIQKRAPVKAPAGPVT